MIVPTWQFRSTEYVRKLCWSPNGQRLAVGLADGTLRLVETTTGSELKVVQAHKGGILSMAWSPDGHYLATGGEDGNACLWHMRRDGPAEILEGGSYWVEHIAWCPRSRRLATAAGRNLRIWNLNGELQHQFSNHASTITGMGWFRDARRLMAASFGGLILWRTGLEGPEATYPWKGSFLNMALSPDNRECAAGTQESSMLVWNVKSGEKVGMTGYQGKISGLAWDSRSRYLASSAGTEAIVWDFAGVGPTGTEPNRLNRHVDRINDLSFLPRQSVLATGGEDGLIICWSLPAGKITHLSILDEPVSVLQWNPTSTFLAVGTAGGTIASFNLSIPTAN